MKTPEEIKEALRDIIAEVGSEKLAIDDAAYQIVHILIPDSEGDIDGSADPAFEKIFDLAADVEIGSDNTEDFEDKAQKLRELLKNL